MEKEQFIENFAKMYDGIDSNDLKPETIFRNLEDWSSIMALELIAMADEEYQVTLSGDDIKKAQTLEDLFQTIISKK